MLKSQGDVYARIQNIGLSDEEAEILIQQAIKAGAEEIETFLRQGRKTEKELMGIRAGLDEHQKREAINNADALKRANAGAAARQAELLAAESAGVHPRRR